MKNYAEFQVAKIALREAILQDSKKPLDELTTRQKDTLTGDLPRTFEKSIINLIVTQAEGSVFFKNQIIAREDLKRIQAGLSLDVMMEDAMAATAK